MNRWSLLTFRSVGQRSRSKVKPTLHMLGKGGICVLQTAIFNFSFFLGIHLAWHSLWLLWKQYNFYVWTINMSIFHFWRMVSQSVGVWRKYHSSYLLAIIQFITKFKIRKCSNCSGVILFSSTFLKLFSFSICMKCLWFPASIIILQLFLKIKIIIRIHGGYLWLCLFTASKLQQIEPKKRKPVVTINPATLRVWKPGEKNIPNFDEKESEVAKFSLFKVQSRKSMW